MEFMLLFYRITSAPRLFKRFGLSATRKPGTTAQAKKLLLELRRRLGQIEAIKIFDNMSRRERVSEKKHRLAETTACLMAFLLILCFATEGEAGDYRVRRKAQNYVVDASINRNPPVMGENTIRIEIRDAGGRTLTGARVSVNYYMPPMPGMVPMNYTIPATPGGNGYTAKMNFIMTGPWNIVIRVESGGSPWRVIVPIDVR